jgi:hypothetical protein
MRGDVVVVVVDAHVPLSAEWTIDIDIGRSDHSHAREPSIWRQRRRGEGFSCYVACCSLFCILDHTTPHHTNPAHPRTRRPAWPGRSFGSFGTLHTSHQHTHLFVHPTMLRLKASEIALTPADVDETLRRMERRQAASPSAALPARIHGPRLPHLFGPRVRRGPERSRDDAVAALGNIPILRPRQVTLESADDAEDASPPTGTLEDHDQSDSTGSPTSSLAGDQTPNAASTRRHIPIPTDSFELPCRPAPPTREGTARPPPRATFSEHIPSSPPKQLFRSSRFGQERTNSSEDGSESTPQARLHAATDGQVDETDTDHATPVNKVRSLRQHSSFNPSPLQRMLPTSSPRQRGGSGDPDPVRNTASRLQKAVHSLLQQF